MGKREEYSKLAREIADVNQDRCEACKNAENICVGRGTEDPTILFVGEAPGEQEDRKGNVFVGPSGKELQKHINKKWDLDKDDKNYHLTNVLKGYPPEGQYDSEYAKKCSEWLEKQIDILEPSLIVAVGKSATNQLLPDKADMDFKGQMTYSVFESEHGKVLPIQHPASFMHSGEDVEYPDDKIREILHTAFLTGLQEEEDIEEGVRDIKGKKVYLKPEESYNDLFFRIKDFNKKFSKEGTGGELEEVEEIVFYAEKTDEIIGYMTPEEYADKATPKFNPRSDDQEYWVRFDEAKGSDQIIGETVERELAEELELNKQRAKELSNFELISPLLAGLHSFTKDNEKAEFEDINQEDRCRINGQEYLLVEEEEDKPAGENADYYVSEKAEDSDEHVLVYREDINEFIYKGFIEPSEDYYEFSDISDKIPKYIERKKDYEKTEDFVHLHVHSEFSIGDAYGEPKYMAETAAKKGFKSMAITDHGTLGGNYRFQKKMKEKNIDPIMGVELYICDDKDKDDKERNHITVLAKNQEGLQNIRELVTLGNREGFYYKPRVEYEDVVDHKEGLIVLSGCADGLVTSNLIQSYKESKIEEAKKKKKKAKMWAERMKEDFGEEDLYIEVMPIDYDQQRKANHDLFDIADELGLETVMTFDVHYPKEEDWEARRAIRAVNWNKNYYDTPEDKGYYMKTDEEVREAAKDADFPEERIEEAFSNTQEIADKCNAEFEPKEEIEMPEFKIPEQFSDYIESKEEFLWYLIDAGMKDREVPKTMVEHKLQVRGLTEKQLEELYGVEYIDLDGEKHKMSDSEAEYVIDKHGIDKLYTEFNLGKQDSKEIADVERGDGKWTLEDEIENRIQTEVDRFGEKNFYDYFLMVWDMVLEAKQRGIMVGPGRGSAGGSYVCYLIEILDIDSVRRDLMFDRFISPIRKDLPDIDLDFQHDRREEIIQYLRDKYGSDHVCMIITNSRFHGKGAIRDTGRIFDIPDEEIDQASDLVIQRSGGDARADFTIEDSIEDFPKFREYYQEHPKAIELAKKIEGHLRHRSIHAAGVVVSENPIESTISVERKNGEMASAVEKKELEDLGLLKLDVLGLKTLTVISRTLEDINDEVDEEVELPNTMQDDRVYDEVFADGDTTGVFQFNTTGVSRYTSDIQPSEFRHLTHINGLYRPGPLHSGSSADYKYRHIGEQEVEYIHDKVKPFTTETYGIVIFQEQVMKIMHEIGSFSWATAEASRKIITKRKGEKMFERFRNEFVENAVEDHEDLTEDEANYIFDKVSTFGSYGFNQIHAAEYSKIGYWSAWLKTYYPSFFFANLMTYEGTDDKLKDQIRAARDNWDIEIGTPDINDSGIGFKRADRNKIVTGFDNIDGIGEKTANEIVYNQPYDDFGDLRESTDSRTVHKGVIESLIKAGAFDRWEENRKKLLENIGKIKQGASVTELSDIREEDEWTDEEKFVQASDVLALPPNEPLIEKYPNPLEKGKEPKPETGVEFSEIGSLDFTEEKQRRWVKGIVTLTNFKEEGLEGDWTMFDNVLERRYAHLNINDGTGNVLIHLSPEQYTYFKDVLQRKDGYPVAVKGWSRENYQKIYADSIVVLDEFQNKDSKFHPDNSPVYRFVDGGLDDLKKKAENKYPSKVVKAIESIEYSVSKNNNPYIRFTFTDGSEGLLGAWGGRDKLPDTIFQAGEIVAYNPGGDDGVFMNNVERI